MFVSLAFFQKYERFVDKSAKVLMAETVPLTSDRMFVSIGQGVNDEHELICSIQSTLVISNSKTSKIIYMQSDHYYIFYLNLYS